MSCGAAGVANAVMVDILAGEDFEVPDIDVNDPAFDPPSIEDNPLYDKVLSITNDDLTTRVVGGSGTFDAIMASTKEHLKEEYAKGRITGAEYSKTYIALAQSAMSQGVAFLLGKDQAYWAAVNSQMQALTARVQLAVAKSQLAISIVEMKNQRANYALTKMRLANEDIQYCISKFNLEQLLPSQQVNLDTQNQIAAYNLANLMPLQKAGQQTQNDTAVYNLGTLLPAQKAMADSQKIGQDTDNSISQYNLANTLPVQKQLLEEQVDMAQAQKVGQDTQNAIGDYTLNQIMPEQKRLIVEQLETARAQTLDHRLDGTPIVGQIGKQKALYDQQITSYKRSAELGAARVWADAWLAHKAIDEGIDTPASFNATSVSGVMETVKLNNLL